MQVNDWTVTPTRNGWEVTDNEGISIIFRHQSGAILFTEEFTPQNAKFSPISIDEFLTQRYFKHSDGVLEQKNPREA